MHETVGASRTSVVEKIPSASKLLEPESHANVNKINLADHSNFISAANSNSLACTPHLFRNHSVFM